MMGLEEHLLRMFREDFEFHESAGASHLGHAAAASRPTEPQPAEPSDRPAPAQPAPATAAAAADAPPAVVGTGPAVGAAATETETETATRTAPAAAAASAAPASAGWAPEAERELHQIPFFVRGKARRNTERYARDRGLATITLETLYDAKAHFSR